MANLLAIDWDQQQLHIVGVRTQRRAIRVESATAWDMGEDLTPRSAEAIGKRLREFLKAEQLTAGAAIVAIGREKVILKELRFPAVASGDEAALVRFQATKDVTEAPDALEIDYVQRPTTGGERRALAVLARKDVLTAVRALCRGAGLKLLGVAPRPFGASHALERTLQAGGNTLAPTAMHGVLTVGQRWAELCLFRGHELLLARALPAGPVLVGEVKRNLAVFAAQNAGDPGLAGPATLYVFGNGQAPSAALAQALPCPVEAVSPLTIADALAPHEEHQAALAGAVGLAQRWATGGGLPVNLAVARKTQAASSPARRRVLAYGIAAALLFCVGIGTMYAVLADRRNTLKELTQKKNQLEEDLRGLGQDRADIDGFKEWEQTTIPWLEELYDLTARFPYEKGFRVHHLSVEPGSAKKTAKDGPVARVRITGVSPSKEKDFLVQHLRDTLSHDPHLKATLENFKGREFTIRIDVTKQPASKYDTFLLLPPDLAKVAPFAARKGKIDREGEE